MNCSYGVLKPLWSQVRMEDSDFKKYRDILKRALRTFDYSGNKEFVKSIYVHNGFNPNSVAGFDITGTGLHNGDYIQMMTSLLDTASVDLNPSITIKNKEIKADHPMMKFDIIGCPYEGVISVFMRSEKKK